MVALNPSMGGGSTEQIEAQLKQDKIDLDKDRAELAKSEAEEKRLHDEIDNAHKEIRRLEDLLRTDDPKIKTERSHALKISGEIQQILARQRQDEMKLRQLVEKLRQTQKEQGKMGMGNSRGSSTPRSL